LHHFRCKFQSHFANHNIFGGALKPKFLCGRLGAHTAVESQHREVCLMQVSNDQLMATHEEFRKLAQEHTQYELRLDSLTQKRFLTDDEKLEEVRLKKLKLRLKDQMEGIARQYRQTLQHNQVA
jgi:uncharacterized protein YdcH (DUF465 family)